MYSICFILKKTLSTASNTSKSTKIQVIFSLKLSSHCLSILLWNSSCSRWALDVFGRRNQQSLDDSQFYESAWQINGNSILFLIELEITMATRCLKMFLFFLMKKEAKHYKSIQLICLTWNKMIHFRFDLIKLFIYLFLFKIYNMKKKYRKGNLQYLKILIVYITLFSKWKKEEFWCTIFDPNLKAHFVLLKLVYSAYIEMKWNSTSTPKFFGWFKKMSSRGNENIFLAVF